MRQARLTISDRGGGATAGSCNRVSVGSKTVYARPGTNTDAFSSV